MITYHSVRSGSCYIYRGTASLQPALQVENRRLPHTHRVPSFPATGAARGLTDRTLDPAAMESSDQA